MKTPTMVGLGAGAAVLVVGAVALAAGGAPCDPAQVQPRPLPASSGAPDAATLMRAEYQLACLGYDPNDAGAMRAFADANRDATRAYAGDVDPATLTLGQAERIVALVIDDAYRARVGAPRAPDYQRPVAPASGMLAAHRWRDR